MTLSIKQANKNIKKGIIWTSINSFSVLIIQFISIIVLARILTPEDFATIGIVMFFINLSNLFLDSGMGASLIIKKDVKDIDYSTLFLYNFLIGLFMYFIIFLMSNSIANFYKIKELSSILNVIGISIIISGFGKIQNTILTKNLKFKELAVVSVISSLISLVTALILAFMGFGVWSLVFQNLTYVVLVVILQFAFNRYIPNLIFSSVSFKEQWFFGINLFLASSLQNIYNNIFLALFPKVSSLYFAGLYSQANKIQQIPMGVFSSIIHSVTFPVLSKVIDPIEFKEINRSFAEKIYLVSFTIFFAISLESENLISILLGDKWRDAALLLSIISFSGIGLIVMAIVRNTLKSLSFTKLIFKIEIYKFIIGIFVLAISLFFNNYIIVGGIVISSILSALLSIFILSRKSNYKFSEQTKDIFNPLFLVSLSWGFTNLMTNFIGDPNKFLSLLISLVIFVFSIFIFGIITKNGTMIYFISIIKNYFFIKGTF